MGDEQFLNKEFWGMKYPFKDCARPELKRLHKNACKQCSVESFCKAEEKAKC